MSHLVDLADAFNRNRSKRLRRRRLPLEDLERLDRFILSSFFPLVDDKCLYFIRLTLLNDSKQFNIHWPYNIYIPLPLFTRRVHYADSEVNIEYSKYLCELSYYFH
jgi:hypothetical protein